jgi:hypothetical protein
MAAAAATKLVKNTVHYEEEVPTVSAKSYLAGIASHPGQKVCLSPYPLSDRPRPYTSRIDHQLPHEPLPYLLVDHPLQPHMAHR